MTLPYEQEINRASRARRVIMRELELIQKRAGRLGKQQRHDEARAAHGDASALVLARTLCEQEMARLGTLQRGILAEIEAAKNSAEGVEAAEYLADKERRKP